MLRPGIFSKLTTDRRIATGSREKTAIRTAVSHESPALVLKVRAYGESDKIVTFLTRDFGKLSGIAKGALRSRKRFVNALEPFTRVRLAFRSRPTTDLAFVEEAEIVRAPRNLGRDLDRYAYSTYLLELLDCMVEGREAEADLFDLADETLDVVDRSFPDPLRVEWLRAFEVRLLGLTGFEPRLEECFSCRSPLAEGGRFDPRTGGVTCPRCADDSGLAVSAGALATLASLRAGSVRELGTIPPPLATEARIVLQTFLAHHVRRPLRSPGLLREILGV